MKFLVFLFACCLLTVGWAQITPYTINVDVDTQHELPEVFPLAYNHFDFKTEVPIDTVIVSDTAKWEIKKNEEGHYVLEGRVYTRSKRIDFDSTLNIYVHLENQEVIALTAPIRIYAEVKVVPYGKEISYDSIYTTLPCSESIGFWAQWVYPEHVKKRWRIYVVFEIDVLLEGERIGGKSGWYDSGDRCKPFDLTRYPKDAEVVLKLRADRLKTLTRFTQNGEIKHPLQLSQEYPSEWKVECE